MIDKLKLGDILYTFCNSLGFCEFTVIKKVDGTVICEDTDKFRVHLTKERFSNFFLTKDEALISSYKKELSSLNKEREKYERMVVNIQKQIDGLNEKFIHLVEKYPEEFL